MDSIDRYLAETAEMINALPRDDIRRVVTRLREARLSGHHVFIMGNGGSAATASHMACDLGRTLVSSNEKGVRAIALTDNAALMTAWANDSAYENVFAEQLRSFVQPGDVVIAISGSGNSPNVVRAVKVAKEAGATTVGFTGAPGGMLRDLVDIGVVVPARQIEHAEDGHLILDHVISVALREEISTAST